MSAWDMNGKISPRCRNTLFSKWLASHVAPSSFGETLSIKTKLNICLLEIVYYCDKGVANSGSFS